MITADTLGDSRMFPILITLAELLNASNDKVIRYSTTIIRELHESYSHLNSLDKTWRIYFMGLAKEDLLKRLDQCKTFDSGDNYSNVYSHLRNYIYAYHRAKSLRLYTL